MTDLDDEQRALIPHPQLELSFHCMLKGIQAGSCLTWSTVFPYQLYRSRKNLSLRAILSRVGTGTIYGSFIGIGGSLLMMHLKLSQENYNEYRIWDRAYRLRYSLTQQRNDRLAYRSAIVGGFAGLILGLPSKLHPISMLKGSLMAIPFGILTHIAISAKPNK